MKPYAAAPARIPRSGIREIMDLAWATPGVIHLEVGQPDFDTPDHIVEAAGRAAREGHTRYVPNAGIDPLRAAAARCVEGRTGVPTTPEHILVTQGAVLSVATAFLSLLEIYSEIVFDGADHVSCASHDPDERVILVTGMSKSYAMTGFRVGFTRARPDYIEMASKLQEPLVSCGVAFAQMAAVEALEGPQDCVREMRGAYQRRRDLALQVLREHGLYRYTPGGAFYLLVDISASGMASRDFCLELIERHKVAVAPGRTFGRVCADHVRISIAAPEENIREGLTRICRMVREKAEGAAPAAAGG